MNSQVCAYNKRLDTTMANFQELQPINGQLFIICKLFSLSNQSESIVFVTA